MTRLITRAEAERRKATAARVAEREAKKAALAAERQLLREQTAQFIPVPPPPIPDESPTVVDPA